MLLYVGRTFPVGASGEAKLKERWSSQLIEFEKEPKFLSTEKTRKPHKKKKNKENARGNT